jgi:hypothetical protein
VKQSCIKKAASKQEAKCELAAQGAKHKATRQAEQGIFVCVIE